MCESDPADEAELVGVVAARILHGDAVLQRLARIGADDRWEFSRVLRKSDQKAHDLITGELVVRRQQRVGLRLALDLLHFDQALVAVARGGPGRVDRPAEAVHVGRIHPAVGEVGVVGDGKQLVAGLALRVHPLPQVLRMPGVEGRKRLVRHLGAIAEIDVAMQVAETELGREFVRAESGERARLVVLVGDLDVLLPDRSGHLRAHESLDRWSTHQLEQVLEDPLHIGGIVRILEDQRRRLGHLADRRARRVRLLGDADIFGMVGHPHPVQRLLDLDVVAERMLDRLALAIFQRGVRTGHVVAEQPGVDGPARMDVLFAEIGIAVLGLSRCHSQKRCGARKQRALSSIELLMAFPPLMLLMRRVLLVMQRHPVSGTLRYYGRADPVRFLIVNYSRGAIVGRVGAVAYMTSAGHPPFAIDRRCPHADLRLPKGAGIASSSHEHGHAAQLSRWLSSGRNRLFALGAAHPHGTGRKC